MAYTYGTIIESTSSIDLYNVDSTTGELVINVSHKATLASEIGTDSLRVQLLTCMPIYTTAPMQYLCFLTDFTTVSANSASSTYTIKHDVYHSTIALSTGNFVTASSLFDASSYGLNGNA